MRHDDIIYTLCWILVATGSTYLMSVIRQWIKRRWQQWRETNAQPWGGYFEPMITHQWGDQPPELGGKHRR